MGILCCPGPASIREFANSVAIWEVRKWSGPKSLEVFYHCERFIILSPAQDPPKIQGRVLNVMERRVRIIEKAPGTEIVSPVSRRGVNFPCIRTPRSLILSCSPYFAFSNSLKSCVWILLTFFCGAQCLILLCSVTGKHVLMFHLLSVGTWVSLDFSSLIALWPQFSDGSSKSYHFMVYPAIAVVLGCEQYSSQLSTS